MIFLGSSNTICHHLNQLKLPNERSFVIVANNFSGNRSLQKIIWQGISLELFSKIMHSLMHGAERYRWRSRCGHQMFDNHAEPPAFQPFNECSAMLWPCHKAKCCL